MLMINLILSILVLISGHMTVRAKVLQQDSPKQSQLKEESKERFINDKQNIWLKPPKIQLSDEISEKYTNHKSLVVHVKFMADTQGRITHARIAHSSGDRVIDQLALQALLEARIKPYSQNDIAVPIIAVQPMLVSFPTCMFESRLLCKIF